MMPVLSTSRRSRQSTQPQISLQLHTPTATDDTSTLTVTSTTHKCVSSSLSEKRQQLHDPSILILAGRSLHSFATAVTYFLACFFVDRQPILNEHRQAWRILHTSLATADLMKLYIGPGKCATGVAAAAERYDGYDQRAMMQTMLLRTSVTGVHPELGDRRFPRTSYISNSHTSPSLILYQNIAHREQYSGFIVTDLLSV